ncbi:MAG: hypothetical protein KAU21_20420 [Gammaproteobacteria bacterium]|nr:hypothetical protein [Gammaproteobacteria bacterium]
MELTDIEKSLALHIFKNWKYEIDGIEANTFRVRNHKHLDIIDKLTSDVIERKSKVYFVPYTSLLLLENDEVNHFIESLEPLYTLLRNNYIKDPEGSTKFSSLEELFNSDKDNYKKAIRYLFDSSVINCYPDNIFDEDNATHYSEYTLRHESYMNYIQWWTNIRFQLEKPLIKKPGNTEANASKREEILGAAIAVIANFREDCSWAGSIVGKRVYKQIYEKSLIWWPDGEVPLGDETSIELINKWLKTIK